MPMPAYHVFDQIDASTGRGSVDAFNLTVTFFLRILGYVFIRLDLIFVNVYITFAF
jgi:hypothetical protein